MVHLYHLLDSPVIYTAEMRGILENTPPEAISGAEGCKLPIGAYFPIHPDSRQCIDILFQGGSVLEITSQIAG